MRTVGRRRRQGETGNLLHMGPRSPELDTRDGSLGYAKLGSQVLLHSLSLLRANVTDLVVREFVSPVAGPCPWRISTSLLPVAHIVPMCSRLEMSRVDTSPVVTLMADHHPLRDRAVDSAKCLTMRTVIDSLGELIPTVAVRIDKRSPFPASVITKNIGLAPESVGFINHTRLISQVAE